MLQDLRVEVHHIAQPEACGFQVRENLQAMNIGQPVDHLQLDDHHTSDNQVHDMAVDLPTLVWHQDLFLTLVPESLLFEFETECALVDALLESGPEDAVDRDPATD